MNNDHDGTEGLGRSSPITSCDRYRLATALLLWREFHALGGRHAEPDPDAEMQRLAEMMQVWQQVQELRGKIEWEKRGKRK